MKLVNSINNEKGEMLLSTYGSSFAVGFQGDANFIKRSFNWAFNTGLVSQSAKEHFLYYEGESIGYIIVRNDLSHSEDLVREYNLRGLKLPSVRTAKEKIIDALALQFYAEIIIENEEVKTKWKYDLREDAFFADYNDSDIKDLALKKANRFWEEKIKYNNFITNQTVNGGEYHYIV